LSNDFESVGTWPTPEIPSIKIDDCSIFRGITSIRIRGVTRIAGGTKLPRGNVIFNRKQVFSGVIGTVNIDTIPLPEAGVITGKDYIAVGTILLPEGGVVKTGESLPKGITITCGNILPKGEVIINGREVFRGTIGIVEIDSVTLPESPVRIGSKIPVSGVIFDGKPISRLGIGTVMIDSIPLPE